MVDLPHDRLLTADDIVQILALRSKRSVYALVDAGLPYLKIGRLLRFSPEAIEKFLRAAEGAS